MLSCLKCLLITDQLNLVKGTNSNSWWAKIVYLSRHSIRKKSSVGLSTLITFVINKSTGNASSYMASYYNSSHPTIFVVLMLDSRWYPKTWRLGICTTFCDDKQMKTLVVIARNLNWVAQVTFHHYRATVELWVTNN